MHDQTIVAESKPSPFSVSSGSSLASSSVLSFWELLLGVTWLSLTREVSGFYDNTGRHSAKVFYRSWFLWYRCPFLDSCLLKCLDDWHSRVFHLLKVICLLVDKHEDRIQHRLNTVIVLIQNVAQLTKELGRNNLMRNLFHHSLCLQFWTGQCGQCGQWR